jgi:hypothetical protein
MMVPVARLLTSNDEMRDFEGSSYGVNRVLSEHLPGETEENDENFTCNVPAEIHTKHFLNTSVEH